MKTTANEYDQQAEAFLSKNGLKFRATLSNSKTAPWSDDGQERNHYRITLSRPSEISKLKPGSVYPLNTRLTFDFWTSINATIAGEAPSAYHVLACISSDAYCEERFEDWCSDSGYDTDSIKARQMHKRCLSFAKRLQAFFTKAELEQLAEIA